MWFYLLCLGVALLDGSPAARMLQPVHVYLQIALWQIASRPCLLQADSQQC